MKIRSIYNLFIISFLALPEKSPKMSMKTKLFQVP